MSKAIDKVKVGLEQLQTNTKCIDNLQKIAIPDSGSKKIQGAGSKAKTVLKHDEDSCR